MNSKKVESKNLYIIEVTETLQRLVVVEANNKEEALIDVNDRYDRGSLSLGDLDVVDSSIELFQYSHPEEVSYLLETHFEETKSSTEKLMNFIENFDKMRGLEKKI